jgi:hypothetical protein
VEDALVGDDGEDGDGDEEELLGQGVQLDQFALEGLYCHMVDHD